MGGTRLCEVNSGARQTYERCATFRAQKATRLSLCGLSQRYAGRNELFLNDVRDEAFEGGFIQLAQRVHEPEIGIEAAAERLAVGEPQRPDVHLAVYPGYLVIRVAVLMVGVIAFQCLPP